MISASNLNYKDFLLTEYDNVAQAHFKSIETISNFFRYYLLLMSVPLTIVGVVQKIGTEGSVTDFPGSYLFPMLLFIVALIGLGLFAYVINLRLDVVLYARTVNAIRKQFYDDADLDPALKLQLKVLPHSPTLPPYHEKSFFFPVVIVFALINSCYILFAIMIALATPEIVEIVNNVILVDIPLWLATSGVVLIFLLSHFAIYYRYARYRELGYLRSNIIGVDIDGVLNMHEKHFCELLKSHTGKELKPDKIKIIPVHEDESSLITREDEYAVFNDPKYWTDMPVISYARDVLKKLQNHFKIKIYIFTYRPWPDNSNKALLTNQQSMFWKACGNNIISYRPICWFFSKCRINPIRRITKKWLTAKNIRYNRLVIEKGNDFSSDPFAHFENRFYISRKKNIRYFVEDDLEKAIKLSVICDVVFLISHPYNESSPILPEKINSYRDNIPSNIIRVEGWREIYQSIKRFS